MTTITRTSLSLLASTTRVFTTVTLTRPGACQSSERPFLLLVQVCRQAHAELEPDLVLDVQGHACGADMQEMHRSHAVSLRKHSDGYPHGRLSRSAQGYARGK